MTTRSLTLALTLLAGCAPGDYRAETEVRPDGSVARTVHQSDLRGTVAEIGDRWDSRRPAAAADAAEWRTPLAEAPKPVRTSNGVVATVVAPSAAELPEAVRFGRAGAFLANQYDLEVPEAVTTRDAAVTDYGVLTLYDWTETLTAGTDPVRMERARRRAVRSAAELLGPALTEAVGDGTDASKLAEWVRTTGDDWTADLQAAAFAAAAEPGRLHEVSGDRFREVARDYGLDAPDPREDPGAARAAGEAFVDDLLGTHVTRHGEPLAGGDLERAKEALGLAGSADVLTVWDVAFVGRSGSAEAGRAAVLQILADLLGPTGLESHALAYRHRTPGLLLGTSGSVLSPGGDGEPAEVLFHFPLREAWPFGAAMTCRSAVLHPDRQRELLGSVEIDDRAGAVRFLQRMEQPGNREKWLEAVGSGDGEARRTLLR